jgi:hypothetical protein
VETTWTLESVSREGEPHASLFLEGPWNAEVQAVWEREGLDALAWTPLGHPIDVLPDLRGLARLGLAGRCDDVRPALACPDLRVLSLYVSDPRPLDLGTLWALEVLETDSDVEPATLSKVPSLRELRLEKWDGSDLGPWLEDSRLERLQIDNVPKLASLSGASSTLRELNLANGRRAVSCRGAEFPALETLELERIDVRDVDCLARLPSLRHVTFVQSRGLSDVHWVQQLPSLESFSYEGTALRDPDLSALDPVSRRGRVHVSPHREYNRRFVPPAIDADDVS